MMTGFLYKCWVPEQEGCDLLVPVMRSAAERILQRWHPSLGVTEELCEDEGCRDSGGLQFAPEPPAPEAPQVRRKLAKYERLFLLEVGLWLQASKTGCLSCSSVYAPRGVFLAPRGVFQLGALQGAHCLPHLACVATNRKC